MTFRLQAKNIFLTYPQCTLSSTILLEYLSGLLSDHQVKYLCVASESHQDGSPHLHALICLGKKLHVRSANFFDVDDFHPNVQAARDPKQVLDYIKKDGVFEETGVPPTTKPSWSDCLVATTKQEFLQLVKATSPRDYVLNYERLISFADVHYPSPQLPYQSRFTNDNFNVPDILAEWEHESLDPTTGMYGPKPHFVWLYALGGHGGAPDHTSCGVPSASTLGLIKWLLTSFVNY